MTREIASPMVRNVSHLYPTILKAPKRLLPLKYGMKMTVKRGSACFSWNNSSAIKAFIPASIQVRPRLSEKMVTEIRELGNA